MSKITCKTCPHARAITRSTNDNIRYVVCGLVDGKSLISSCGLPPSQCRMIGHICSKCADRLRWTWPTGHVASFYTGICDVCGKTVTVTDARGYLAPESKGGAK